MAISTLLKAKDKNLLTKRLGADKAYDDYDFRVSLMKENIIPVIEFRKSTKSKVYEKEFKENKGYCYQRWRVEKNFALKDNKNRRIDQFYEKSIHSYERLYFISVIRHYLSLCRNFLS